MLRLNNITKDYIVAGQSVPALKGVSVNFRESEFVSILGASGCGKTTLLNIIGGLDKYTDGDLVIDGRSTRDFGDRDWDVYRNHRIGFIFQSYNLIPHQTVLGNVELALTIAGVSKAERRERAEAALIRVGLGDQINKRPNQLSGGQCQRVAIARALVNDPEILLADEPTGALDTKTSVQIMDLMKEIAGERLVVMVTHNPELAEQYSTRIISLRDGLIINDTKPYSDEEEMEECMRRSQKAAEEKTEEEAEAENGKTKTAKKKQEKAKMGMLAAFALSMRNLIAKKGRTIMVGIAGSIGIIGVAIVLAFSSGISNYIYNMETDMLSGYPVTVAESAVDYSQLMNMTRSLNANNGETHAPDKIYVNSVVKALTELSSMTVTNNITSEYIGFVGKMPSEHYKTIKYNYGINYANNIYTEFTYDSDDPDLAIVSEEISVTGIRSVYTAVLKEIETYKQYANMVNSITTFSEMPDSEDYIRTQYDVVAGEYPAQNDKNALVLVLSPDDEVNDLTLAQLGYVSARQFLNYAFELTGTDNEFYDETKPSISKEYEYSDFVGDGAHSFTWYPNRLVYTYKKGTDAVANPDSYVYNTYSADFTDASYTGEEEYDPKNDKDAVKLNVKCILKPKSDVQFGSLSTGMYYTKALTDHVRAIETNEETMSDITRNARNSGGEKKFVSNVTYSYHYYSDKKDEETGEIRRNQYTNLPEQSFGTTASESMTAVGLSAITSMYTRDEFSAYIDEMLSALPAEMQVTLLKATFLQLLYGSSDKVVYLSELGGAELPTSMAFYTDDFKEKDKITAYLDTWNDPAEGHVWKTDEEGNYVLDEEGNKIVDEAKKVKYTDTIGVVMTMVNQLITMVTTALVAFTSIALVVSTVMIGIITYVSVVERTKEIGVIRAMGGSKRDIKNLFNAETFIIGLFAGLIGIVMTYLLSLVANLIIGGLSGIYTIASLPFWQALIMVVLSVCLTLISGLIPASKAAKKDPVVALRTE